MIRTLLALTLAMGLSACGVVSNTPLPSGSSSPNVPNPSDSVPRMTASELMLKQSAGEGLVVLDVRNAAAYRSEHVKGAENVTTDAIASGAGGWSKESTLVTYCTCVNEGSAAKAALALQARGYSKVFALKEGLAGWKAAGGALDMEASASASPAP